MTPLDRAVEQMELAPDQDALRLAFYERLAASEVFLLLAADPVGEAIEPKLFDTSSGTFALVFDSEDRLAEFADGAVPYASLTGRAIVEMLAGQSIGLGLNLGVAPSSHLVPADAVTWLAETLATAPREAAERPERFSPPGQLPETLLTALDARLAQAGGLASGAYLASVDYEGGRRGHLLAVVDARDGAERAIARAIQDALTFSGLEAGALDVTFLKASDPAMAGLAKVGLRFELPEPQTPEPPAPPGMDPDKPPRLV